MRILGLALLSCLLAACSTEARPRAAPAHPETLEVVAAPLTLRHLLSGELRAERAVELAAPEIGVVPLQIRWLAENGSEVAAGDQIVELDNTQLVNNLEQLESAVIKAEMALETARSKAASDIAQAEFDVWRKRAEHDKATIAADVPESLRAARDYQQLQLDRQRSALELREAEHKLAAEQEKSTAEVGIARIVLDKAQDQRRHSTAGLDELSLRAPRAGIVIVQQNPREDRVWQEGDNAWPGWVIARLPELDSMVVEAQLYDVDDGQIAAGAKATVTLDAFPELAIGGRVRSIERIARQEDRRSLVRAFAVTVDLERVDLERMRPGMSAKVAIERTLGATGSPPLLAPRAALDLGPSPRAHLASGDWREVKLGACSAQLCIVEDGLELGERLATVHDLAAEAP